jgi:hypothetical protein
MGYLRMLPVTLFIACLFASTNAVAGILDNLDLRGTGLQFPGHILIQKFPKTDVVGKRCLISWEDSFQPHSTKVIVQPGYQAVKHTWKKLSHCIELTTIGPVDVQGVAKEYVDQCVNYALSDRQTEFLIRAAVALGADILGAGGAASAANVAAYVDHVSSTAIRCLTDSARIDKHLAATLQGTFNATVSNESHWVYWEL